MTDVPSDAFAEAKERAWHGALARSLDLYNAACAGMGPHLSEGDDRRLFFDAGFAAARVQDAPCKWSLALQSLTPGGSEYADDPAACVAFVREARESQHQTILKAVKRAKDAESRVQDAPVDVTQLTASIVRRLGAKELLERSASVAGNLARANETFAIITDELSNALARLRSGEQKSEPGPFCCNKCGYVGNRQAHHTSEAAECQYDAARLRSVDVTCCRCGNVTSEHCDVFHEYEWYQAGNRCLLSAHHIFARHPKPKPAAAPVEQPERCGHALIGECPTCEKDSLARMVDAFAAEMKSKLWQKFDEGYSGWDDAKHRAAIVRSLQRHVERGEGQWIDAANLAAMLWRMDAASPEPTERQAERCAKCDTPLVTYNVKRCRFEHQDVQPIQETPELQGVEKCARCGQDRYARGGDVHCSGDCDDASHDQEGGCHRFASTERVTEEEKMQTLADDVLDIVRELYKHSDDSAMVYRLTRQLHEWAERPSSPSPNVHQTCTCFCHASAGGTCDLCKGKYGHVPCPPPPPKFDYDGIAHEIFVGLHVDFPDNAEMERFIASELRRLLGGEK